MTRLGRRRRMSDDVTPEDALEEVGVEFEQYVCDLISHL